MVITASGGKLHWNYLLALDRDMESVSRYIEFAEPNFSAYSIELAHLLFAASSEVDVVAKLVCAQLDPAAPRGNIDQYRAVLVRHLPPLPNTPVHVPRYGLVFRPWDNWASGRNPAWWRSYNNVKHERDQYFHEATLKNALNALGALLLLTYHYYALSLRAAGNSLGDERDVTRRLVPGTSLIRFPDGWYDDFLVV